MQSSDVAPPQLTAEVYSKYAQMRRTAAVIALPLGMLAVTRYADVKRVLMDYPTFSARLDDYAPFATFGPSPVQDQIDRIMQDYSEEPVLMRTDPPAHTRVRKLVSRVLTPADVERMEPELRELVAELAAPWLPDGRVEFVGSFASRLPGAVTTRFLAAPPEMRERFRFWADEVMSRFDGPQSPERQLEVARNIADMGRYFLDEIACCRREPNGSLVSLLTHAEVDGDRLDDDSIINVIQTFLIGGHETTTFLLGHALYELARNPALAHVLRAEPARIPDFVEEMLRLHSPAQAVLRSATRDVEIGGVQVPAGAILCVVLASANRDESVFEDPDAIRLDRTSSSSAPRHLAFGHGVHICSGIHLARAEARIALGFLLERMHDISLGSDDPIERMENFMIRGPTRLDLAFSPG